MLVAPNCQCGGGPELSIVRGERVFRTTLDFEDKMVLQKDDVVFTNCDTCGAPMELKEVKVTSAKA